MRRRFVSILLGALLLIGGLIGSTLAAPHASAASLAPFSIPGCADYDYSCGFLHGFADGRTAAQLGLCEQHRHHYYTLETASERGYREAFEHYCPA